MDGKTVQLLSTNKNTAKMAEVTQQVQRLSKVQTKQETKAQITNPVRLTPQGALDSI